MPDIEHIKHLLRKVQKQSATPAELEELLSMLRTDLPEEIIDQINDFHAGSHTVPADQQPGYAYWEKAASDILNMDKGAPALPATHRVHFLKTAWLRYAAAIVVLVGIGLLVRQITSETPSGVTKVQPVPAKNDVDPGHDGAVLTLANGTKMVLDSLHSGVIGNQEGTSLVLNKGQLVYDPSGNMSGNIAYNIMTTPRGRQFHVQLPDGTKVWLNAASSIRYPTRFAGKKREVEISGEAYFEVAKNESQPFIVNISDRTSIEVLGTHFNINAYEDEPYVRTTLLEGAIRLKVGKRTRLLAPGQQAQVLAGTTTKVLNNINANQVIAWKNGLFTLEDMSIREIMRQIERWYDVEVRYEGKVPEARFKGEIDKGVKLSEVLKFFADSEIPLKLEGRTLTVYGSNWMP